MKEPRREPPIEAREGEIGACSWRVGDAMPEGPILAYAHDMNHMVHDAAVAHHGPMRECRWTYFSNGESEFGRAEFLDEIAQMGGGPEEIARGAAEWDGCHRPIAVTHVGLIDGRSHARREQAHRN